MIKILDVQVLQAAAIIIDGAVPVGIKRIYKSVGVHNPTGATVQLLIWLVPVGLAQGDSTRLISRYVPAGKTDMCPELIGRGLQEGGTLRAVGSGLVFGYTALETEA